MARKTGTRSSIDICLRPPAKRRLSDEAFEHRREMGLRTEAATQCDIEQAMA
jgi:hypothetical protein